MARLVFALLLILSSLTWARSRLPAETSLLTPEEARQAFVIVARDGVPRTILQDGCQTRSFYGAQALLKYAVRPAQIEASGDDLGIYSNHSLTGEKFISWTNHTALAIEVLQPSTKTQIKIIDPSLFSQVVDEKTWLKKISEKPTAKIKNIDFYPPEIFLRTLPPYTDSHAQAYEQLKLLVKYERELKTGKAPPQIASEMEQDTLDFLFRKTTD